MKKKLPVVEAMQLAWMDDMAVIAMKLGKTGQMLMATGRQTSRAFEKGSSICHGDAKEG